MLDTERILGFVKQAGYSEYAVCKALKWGNGVISKWDKSSPSINKLYDLSNLIGVPLQVLLCDDKPDAPYVLPEEFAIIEKLRALPPEKRKAIEALLD